MDTKEYNGWTNYATWNVSLYLNNDYEWYKGLQRLTLNCCINDTKLDAIEEMETNLPKYVAQLANEDGSFGDLKADELRDVNWTEIAEGEIDAEWSEKECE